MTKSERIEELEELLRSHNATGFIDTVQQADATQYRVMSLSAFYQEPELLYAALEYASYWGVSITITPLIDEHLLND